MKPSTTFLAYHTNPEPIDPIRARENVAKQLGVDRVRVQIVDVYARVERVTNGAGMLIDYRTQWEFTAEFPLGVAIGHLLKDRR